MPTREQIAQLIGAGNAAAAEGRMPEAEAMLLEACRHQPRNPEALKLLALVQSHVGRHDDAAKTIGRVLPLAPRDPAAHLAAGWIARVAGKGEEARKAYTRAEFFDPGNLDALTALAVIAESRHELDEAETFADRAIAAHSNAVDASVLKAKLMRRRGNLESAERWLRGLIERGKPPHLTHTISFELGRVLDKAGRFDEAFATFADANRDQAALPANAAHNGDVFFARVAFRRAVTNEQLDRWAGAEPPDDGPPPVFLVGMPRSGTTMTEQILEAHPGVHSSGERTILRNTLNRLEERFPGVPLAEQLDRLDAGQIGELRSIYRRDSADTIKGTGATVMLDKLPLQITSAPIISRLFPDARFIVAIRDPRNVCLSCFVQEFGLNSSMVNFTDLVRTARVYETVMSMYLAQREHYAFERLELRYEDTTAEFEDQARRLLDFAGLPWDPGVLRFFERDRGEVINTPSYEAVTHPVHRGAVGRWRNYAEQLKPILPTLEPFVEAFGYEPSTEN